jgi:hypothetical protein
MFNAVPAVPGSVTPPPAALASMVSAGQVAGMMPVTAVPPVITNEAVDFHLRHQAQPKIPPLEKEKTKEPDVAAALPGYAIPFGFAPFFAQMFAQGQVTGTDMDAMFRQAMDNSPKNFSIGSESFLHPLQDQLLHNAPPYRGDEQMAVAEAQDAVQQVALQNANDVRRIYTSDYGYGAYRASMTAEA